MVTSSRCLAAKVRAGRKPGANHGSCQAPIRRSTCPVVSQSSRLGPPVPGNRPYVPRPRLLATLAGRFDRRLTTVVAGPGFGKTALLTSALAENELQPRGVDVWLQCRPDDADAAELAAGLLTALGRQAEPTVDAVIDAPWSRAPRTWRRRSTMSTPSRRPRRGRTGNGRSSRGPPGGTGTCSSPAATCRRYRWPVSG